MQTKYKYYNLSSSTSSQHWSTSRGMTSWNGRVKRPPSWVRRMFSFSHLGLVANPRFAPLSTYGEVWPPTVEGRLQREIALFFHRVVEPGGRSEVPTDTPLSISSKILDDLLLESEFLCQTFDQCRLRSGRECLVGLREESELVSMFRDHHPVKGRELMAASFFSSYTCLFPKTFLKQRLVVPTISSHHPPHQTARGTMNFQVMPSCA